MNIDEIELHKEISFETNKRWWNCHTNLLADVTRGFDLPERVYIKDETLREGLTVPGRRRMSQAELIKMATLIYEAGIEEFEVGFPAAVTEHRMLADQLRKEVPLKQSAHTRTWAVDWRKEIDLVVELGADIVNLIGFGSAETEKFIMPHITKSQMPELFGQQTTYAKASGKKVSFMLSTNVTLMDLAKACYTAVAEAGVDRVYIADSYGVSTPEGTRFLTAWVKSICGSNVEVGFHGHNDLGLATANALAAVTAGASVVDTSANSLGDRAGISNFASVVGALEVLYGVSTGIDLAKLKKVSELAAEIWGIPIPPHEPVIGRNIYRHETDLHIAALLSGHWYAYNVIHPEVLGEKESLEFGPASLAKGEMSAIGIKIEMMGFKPTEQRVEAVLERIRDVIAKSPDGWATEEQVETIILETMG